VLDTGNGTGYGLGLRPVAEFSPFPLLRTKSVISVSPADDRIAERTTSTHTSKKPHP